MNKIVKLTAAAAVSAFLAACGSTPEPDLNANIPDFVLNPVVEDGIAAAACVAASNNMSTDKAQAQALARVELAQQISTKVQALDKTYQERVDVDGKTSTGSTFSSVSKQLADQSLNGSRVIKTSYADFNGENQLCVLVALGSSSTKELFDNLVKESDRTLSMDDERVLYQEFKAHKAKQELDAELAKKRN